MEWNLEGGNLKFIAQETSWQYDLLDFANAPKGESCSGHLKLNKQKTLENITAKGNQYVVHRNIEQLADYLPSLKSQALQWKITVKMQTNYEWQKTTHLNEKNSLSRHHSRQ